MYKDHHGMMLIQVKPHQAMRSCAAKERSSSN